MSMSTDVSIRGMSILNLKTAYSAFLKEFMQNEKVTDQKSFGEISKKASQLWKTMSADKKAKFQKSDTDRTKKNNPRSMKSSIHIDPNKYMDNISLMFRKLYSDEQMADVTLICKDGTIKAHKIVLASSSPYFHKLFTENPRDHPILIMYGISYRTLKNLIELIYKGNVEVYPEALNSLYELAGEFQLAGVSGILRGDDVGNGRDEDDDSLNDSDSHQRGVKRAAMDYLGLERSSKKPKDLAKLRASFEQKYRSISPRDEESMMEAVSRAEGNFSDEEPKLSAWAKKQRKFQCDLCPSSFKRSSHLIRHQLVHTGERPYACHQCEKAFSRHDKLKHHIAKAHDLGYVDYQMEMMTSSQSRSSSPLPFIVSHVEPVEPVSPVPPPSPVKRPPGRPRGRPRKYPPGQSPHELKQQQQIPLVKRPRGRPRVNPVRPDAQSLQQRQNYDLTNLPFGDLSYLTDSCVDSSIMEPLVEIKTEIGEKAEQCKQEVKQESSTSKDDEAVVVSEESTNEPIACDDGDERDKRQGGTKEEQEQEEEGGEEGEGGDGGEGGEGGEEENDDVEEPEEEEAEEPQEKEKEAQRKEDELSSNLKVLEDKIAEIGECTISVANH